MSDSNSNNHASANGAICWQDLTIDNAEQIRDFYQASLGWVAQSVAMDGYDDFAMYDSAGNCVAGICHHRGTNEGIPPQWLVYVQVDDLDQRLKNVLAHGGKIIREPRPLSGQRCAIIADPAGAVMAICGK